MRTLLATWIVGASLFTLYTGTRATRADVGPSGASVDAILEEALAENPSVSAKRDTRYQLSGSIVSGERGAENGLNSYRCEVSLVLTERETGSVRAFLSGRASGSGPDSTDLEPKVVRAAVKSALRRLASLELP